MPDSDNLYELYQQKMQRIADVRHATALLQWDQETYLPPKGAHFRGQQISTLTELAHGMFTNDGLGSLLQQLLAAGDLNESQKRNVELTNEDYSKNKKYTSEFVRRLSEQTNKAFHAWLEARKQNSFAIFQPQLEALVALKKQEADVLGFEGHPYNALLNEFEKGSTVAAVDHTFSNMLPALKTLMDKIAAKPQVDDHFLQQHFPGDKQWEWGLYLIKQLGFDDAAGRQDKSEHPFSTSIGPQDVRITTRIDENDFSNMTWSCIHEAGHALYEQGLPMEHYGLPLAEACSYSMHESQSRLWENNVGRSKIFWSFYYPVLSRYFPEQFRDVSFDAFYKGINNVQASLIRTEADEISYHFHVYIRYVIEKALIDATLDAKDVPAYWAELYKKWLGLAVPDDKTGCLQDVHWSHGSFGYFPTYSLGSFYAAQFFAAAQKEMTQMTSELSKGESMSLLTWLRERIHAKGRFYTSEQLCREVTGTSLDATFFVHYLTDKYNDIYTF